MLSERVCVECGETFRVADWSGRDTCLGCVARFVGEEPAPEEPEADDAVYEPRQPEGWPGDPAPPGRYRVVLLAAGQPFADAAAVEAFDIVAGAYSNVKLQAVADAHPGRAVALEAWRAWSRSWRRMLAVERLPRDLGGVRYLVLPVI